MKQLFLFLIVLVANFFAQELGNLPCQLTWTAFSSGDKISSPHVASHNEAIFIARVEIPEQALYALGWYDMRKSIAKFFYVDKNTAHLVVMNDIRTFELLTNPHDCEIKWVAGPHVPQNAVKFNFDNSTSSFIARVSAQAEFWYPGTLNSKNQVEVVLENELLSFGSYQLLISSAEGVKLMIEEFQFKADNTPLKVEFVGVDVLSNKADTVMTQYVTHKRKIVERMETQIKKQTTTLSKYTDKMTRNIEFPSLFAFKTNIVSDSKVTMGVEEVKIEIRETEIIMRKAITVPPRKTVTVCSTVDIKDDVEMDYVARGLYSAKGVASKDLYAILKEEGIPVSLALDGQVEQQIEGTFKGSLVFSSKFVAKDGVHESC